MIENEIKLSFINNGKPFRIPRMTVKKQEIIMEKMAELEKSIGAKFDYNRDVGKVALLVAFSEIDSTVTMEHIENMHPEDFRFVFDSFWNNGREIKSDGENFRKKTR